MIEIILSIIFGVFILLSYSLGLKNGQKIVNKEEIKIPSAEKQSTYSLEDKEVYDEEERKLMQLLENIEVYDGTTKGQKVIR